MEVKKRRFEVVIEVSGCLYVPADENEVDSEYDLSTAVWDGLKHMLDKIQGRASNIDAYIEVGR